MSFVEELGYNNTDVFPIVMKAALLSAVQNPAAAAQEQVSSMQAQLWASAMSGITHALKDPRWLTFEEVKRDHPFSNMHLRTVADWIDKRQRYLRAHPPPSEQPIEQISAPDAAQQAAFSPVRQATQDEKAAAAEMEVEIEIPAPAPVVQPSVASTKGIKRKHDSSITPPANSRPKRKTAGRGSHKSRFLQIFGSNRN